MTSADTSSNLKLLFLFFFLDSDNFGVLFRVFGEKELNRTQIKYTRSKVLGQMIPKRLLPTYCQKLKKLAFTLIRLG